MLNSRTRFLEEIFYVTFDDNFIRNLGATHVTTHLLDSDAPPPECPNTQVIHEVDFKTLFEPSETALDSESHSRPTLSSTLPFS